MISDVENWLWKSELHDPLARFLIGRWSAKDLLQWESAICHSIKLGFEGQVAEKFLNGIYYTGLRPDSWVVGTELKKYVGVRKKPR